ALPGSRQVAGALDAGPNWNPARRLRMQVGHVEVGVDHLAERAWDGRRRHEQDVWLEAPGLRLQLPSLLDPEPVLLVDDRQAEPREGDRFLEQRVRADHDGRTAVGDLLQGLAPRIGRERAGQ